MPTKYRIEPEAFRRSRLLGRSFAAFSALTLAGSALAQDSEQVARVIVTGSYIPTAESEGPLPVSVYTAATLQKIGANTPAEGLRQLPSFIGATATENDSNGGNGSARINLRALGAGNTLTLINGRRTFAGGFGDINALGIGYIERAEVLKDGASAVYGSDAVAGVVNFILLNGSGAGKPFTGVEIDLLYGNTSKKDASVKQAYLNAGFTSGDGKLSLVFSANYYDRQAVYSRDRTLSSLADQRPLGGRNGESGTFQGRVNLSSASLLPTTDPVFGAAVNPRNRIIVNDTGFITGLASTRVFNQVLGDGFNFRLYTPAIPAQEKFSYYGAFNYKPFADKRMEIYGDMIYSNTRQDNGLAPSPFSLSVGNVLPVGPLFLAGSAGTAGDGVNLSPFNPFPTNVATPTAQLPFAPGSTTTRVARNLLTSVPYRLVAESGNRRSGFDHKFYRYEGGVKGEFTLKGSPVVGLLTYDFGTLYEEDKQVRTDGGDASRSAIVAQTLPPGALSEAILRRQYTGARLDRALALNRQFGGTFNPFRGENAPSIGTATTYDPATGAANGTRAFDNNAAVARAGYTGQTVSINKQYLVDAKFGGLLFPNLPNNGIGFNVGFEYRQERSSSEADPTQKLGDQLGFNAGADNSYRRSVYSAFAELAVPIITPNMKVPFLQSFDVSGAVRYEKFDVYAGATPGALPGQKASFDNGTTPRLTIRLQPIQDLTLRGSWGKSFASPGYGALFSPVTQNFPQINDPFRGVVIQPPDGVFQKGNASLQPEKTDTYTAGLVYTPAFFKGFTMTVDYYQINTSSLILGPSSFAQLITTLNARNGSFGITADQFRAGVIGVYRDSGDLRGINSQFSNSGKRLVEGLDMTATYELPTTAWGKFTWTLGWNHFFRWKAEAVTGLGATNFRGGNYTALPLAPGAIPNNKGFFRTEWEYRNFNFVATTNYIDGYHNDGSFINGNAQIGGTDANPVYRLVRNSREYITLDVQASYEFKKPTNVATYSKDGKGVRTQVAQTTGGSFSQKLLWGTKLKVGVNNVFDTPPPYDPAAFNDNYDTNSFSIRNRYYYVGVNKKF